MKYLDVFLHKEVSKLIDAFAACFSVKVTVFSANMEELAVGFKHPVSKYCSCIHKELGMLPLCEANNRKMYNLVTKSHKIVTSRCHAGIFESSIPIIIENTLAGHLLIGQFRDNSALPPHIISACMLNKGKNCNISEIYMDLPCFSDELCENMLHLAAMLVQHITAKNYVTVRRGSLIEAVRRYIASHKGVPIRLADTAKELGWSESSISHMIKRELGLTFSRLVTLQKIEAFEQVLIKDPCISIGEAARQVGYYDQFYFSRLYKKERGISPRQFVSSLRNVL